MILSRRILLSILAVSGIIGYAAFMSEFLPLLQGKIQGVQHYFSIYEVVTCSLVAVAAASLLAKRVSLWKAAVVFLLSLILLYLLRYVLFFAFRSILGIWVSVITAGIPPIDRAWNILQWVQGICYATILYVIGTGVAGFPAGLLYYLWVGRECSPNAVVKCSSQDSAKLA
jgi:hypothetical protein